MKNVYLTKKCAAYMTTYHQMITLNAYSVKKRKKEEEEILILHTYKYTLFVLKLQFFQKKKLSPYKKLIHISSKL